MFFRPGWLGGLQRIPGQRCNGRAPSFMRSRRKPEGRRLRWQFKGIRHSLLPLGRWECKGEGEEAELDKMRGVNARKAREAAGGCRQKLDAAQHLTYPDKE